jgi:hypothetical protein
MVKSGSMPIRTGIELIKGHVPDPQHIRMSRLCSYMLEISPQPTFIN